MAKKMTRVKYQKMKRRQRLRLRKWVIVVIFLVFLTIFLLSSSKMLGWFNDYKKSNKVKKYDVIASSNGEQMAVNEKDLKDIVVVNGSTLSSNDEKLVNDAIKNNYTVARNFNIDLFKGLND